MNLNIGTTRTIHLSQAPFCLHPGSLSGSRCLHSMCLGLSSLLEIYLVRFLGNLSPLHPQFHVLSSTDIAGQPELCKLEAISFAL